MPDGQPLPCAAGALSRELAALGVPGNEPKLGSNCAGAASLARAPSALAQGVAAMFSSVEKMKKTAPPRAVFWPWQAQ